MQDKKLLYFEDYNIGDEFYPESYTFTEEKIIDFAKEYDPRPIHIDKEAAKASRFGDIIASGKHTSIACWGQWVKEGIDMDGLVCGVSIDWNKWLKPVYANEKLDITIRVVDKKVRVEGKDGFIVFQMLVTNPKGELALDYGATTLVEYSKEAANHDQNTDEIVEDLEVGEEELVVDEMINEPTHDPGLVNEVDMGLQTDPVVGDHFTPGTKNVDGFKI